MPTPYLLSGLSSNQRTLSVEFPLLDNQFTIIQQTASVELHNNDNKTDKSSGIETTVLINHLSFSHFIELLKTDNFLARAFCEMVSIKNNRTVRGLQRAMNSMLFERTGLKGDLVQIPLKIVDENYVDAKDMFRNPLILEFLNLDEKSEYSESDLEQES